MSLLELITTVFDKTRKTIGGSYNALALPDFVGEETEKELNQARAGKEGQELLDVFRRQCDASFGFWRALGFEEKVENSHFHVLAVE